MAEMTKCWDCAKAANNGCSWSDHLEPVEGWVAVPTVKSQFRGDPLHSFLVMDCPEFERDAWNGGTLRQEQYEEFKRRCRKRNRIHHSAGR